MKQRKTPVGLRAGTARVDLTRSGKAVRLRDPLQAKVLILDDGETRAVMVSMDATAIGARAISAGALPDIGEAFLPALRERIRKTLDIPGENVLVHASHTHPPGRMLCSDEEQVDRVFRAVRRAVRGMEPVRVGAGTGREDRISMHRTLRLKDGRDWTLRHAYSSPPDGEVARAGPIDPEIGVLRIDRADGRPLAVVYNFACHLLFGDVRGALTANLPGTASGLIEAQLGPGVTALFLQGAGGNLCDVEFKDFRRPRDIEPLGLRLGWSTLQAWRNIRTAPARLQTSAATLALPRRKDLPDRMAVLRGERDGLLEALRGNTLNFKTFLPLYLQRAIDPEHPSDHAGRYLHERALGRNDQTAMDAWIAQRVDRYGQCLRVMERLGAIQDDLATLQKHLTINQAAGFADVPAEIQGLRIGRALLLAAPLELLVEIGLRLKQRSPFRPTLIATLSNGYLHYGAPANAYPRGGYEVTECLLAPAWQRRFERGMLDLIEQLQPPGAGR